MKTLIASTALAAAMITPAAFAGEETYTGTETDVAVAADVTLTGFTDDNDWVNKPVFDEEGQPVGEVERVSFNDDGAVSDIVVETGGILEVGGEEILVTESEYTVVVAQGDEDESEIRLEMTAAEFLDLPAFDEDLVSEYPLSDNDLVDGVDESEGEIDDQIGSSETGEDLETGTRTDIDL